MTAGVSSALRRLVEVPLLRDKPLLGYPAAILIVAIATWLRLVPMAELRGVQFITFFPAVLLTTFIAGLGPGLLTAALSALAAWYFIIPAEGSLLIPDASDRASLVLFGALAIVDCLLVHFLLQAVGVSAELAKDRATLLLELQHRVKNHIQLVSALLGLQEREAREAGDERTRAALAGARQRIVTITTAYSNFYEPGKTVEVGAHLRELAGALQQTLAREHLKIEVESAEFHVDIDALVPLSLIASELITNALKHAELGPGSPPVLVAFGPIGKGKLKLMVKDHGGLPEDFSLQRTGLGLKIVMQLAQQLGGELAFERHPVTFHVIFAEPEQIGLLPTRTKRDRPNAADQP